jgi:hypothetical protein
MNADSKNANESAASPGDLGGADFSLRPNIG